MNFNIRQNCYFHQLGNRYILNPNNLQYKNIVGNGFIVKRDKNSQFISASGVSSGGKQNGQILACSIAGPKQWYRFSVARDVNKHDIRIPFKARRKSKLTADDSAVGDDFGYSSVIRGNIAVISALDADADQGAAYVFTKTSGGWTQTTKLTADDAAAGDDFGESVAMAGNVIVVGAASANVGGNANQGAAYVFTKTNGGWTQTAKLTADDGAAGGFFGYSAAMVGNVIVVGSTGADSKGAAYVFTNTSGVWTQTTKLTADDGAASDFFGWSVAMAGNVIVVGAYRSDDVQGAAYVFTNTSGVWTQTTKLTADDGAAGDRFGWSVAMVGSAIVVGVTMADSKGAAYVFTNTSGVWTQTIKLTADDGAAGDRFGWSVAMVGSVIVVGSPMADISGNDQGAAYVFTCKNKVWTQTTKLTVNDGAADDAFGSSVAITGNRAVISAVGADALKGAAYVVDDLLYGSNLQVRLN